MSAGRRVDQLGADAHVAGGFANSAFEDITHAQFPADLLHVDCLALVREAGIAGDDEEPADAGERCDDLLDHAVGEIFLLGIGAHVLERHDRQRRLIRQRRRAARLACRIICRGPFHRDGKPVAAPWDGLDAASPGSCLVEDPADCGNLHVQIGVLDRRGRPDGSHQLVPQYKVSGPVEKHVENVKGTRADSHRHESTGLVTPEQNAGLPVEPEVLELEDATPGHAPSCLPRMF